MSESEEWRQFREEALRVWQNRPVWANHEAEGSMKRHEDKSEYVTRRTLVEMRCDLCGRAANKNGDWITKAYEVAETEINAKTGTSYPEGGSGKEIEYDICPECFTSKLIPWLEAQGAKTEWTDWEW